MSFAPLAAKERRGGICRVTVGTVTPFDKYAESATVAESHIANRLLHNFVKYAEKQSRSDCYAAPAT